MTQLTPELLLNAYAVGIFPMAEARDDPELYWIDPERRGILPLDGFHVPRSLRRTIKRAPFEIRIDSAFREVASVVAFIAHARGFAGRARIRTSKHELIRTAEIHRRHVA